MTVRCSSPSNCEHLLHIIPCATAVFLCSDSGHAHDPKDSAAITARHRTANHDHDTHFCRFRVSVCRPGKASIAPYESRAVRTLPLNSRQRLLASMLVDLYDLVAVQNAYLHTCTHVHAHACVRMHESQLPCMHVLLMFSQLILLVDCNC
jgi:hypothetical protein